MRRQTNRVPFVIAAVLACASTPAFSAEVELTPMLGYRWGGEIQAEDTALFSTDVEVNAGESFGLVINVPITRYFQLELMADRQDAELGEDLLFAPDFQGGEIGLTYYHVGALWQFHTGRFSPFVVSSIGVTSLDPDLPGARSDTRFSASLGGGVKLRVNEYLGFRLEARGFWTDTSEDEWWDDDWWDDNYWDDCWEDKHHDCHRNGDFEDLTQAQIRVGVIITF